MLAIRSARTRLLVLSIAAASGPYAAGAATITVNSTADAAANDGQCTLREAINAAKNDTASGAAFGGSDDKVVDNFIGDGARGPEGDGDGNRERP